MPPNPYLKAIAPDAVKPASSSTSAANRKPKGAGKGKQPAAAPKATRNPSDDALRADILALGGDEADLDLLAGIDSDSELEGESDGDADASTQKKGKGGANGDVSILRFRARRTQLTRRTLPPGWTPEGPQVVRQGTRLPGRWRIPACRG